MQESYDSVQWPNSEILELLDRTGRRLLVFTGCRLVVFHNSQNEKRPFNVKKSFKDSGTMHKVGEQTFPSIFKTKKGALTATPHTRPTRIRPDQAGWLTIASAGDILPGTAAAMPPNGTISSETAAELKPNCARPPHLGRTTIGHSVCDPLQANAMP